MLIRHDTRYKLAALTAELWGRGRDAGGVEEADAASTGGARQRGSRLPQMAAASVVFPTVFWRRPGMWTVWAALTSSGRGASCQGAREVSSVPHVGMPAKLRGG